MGSLLFTPFDRQYEKARKYFWLSSRKYFSPTTVDALHYLEKFTHITSLELHVVLTRSPKDYLISRRFRRSWWPYMEFWVFRTITGNFWTLTSGETSNKRAAKNVILEWLLKYPHNITRGMQTYIYNSTWETGYYSPHIIPVARDIGMNYNNPDRLRSMLRRTEQPLIHYSILDTPPKIVASVGTIDDPKKYFTLW